MSGSSRSTESLQGLFLPIPPVFLHVLCSLGSWWDLWELTWRMKIPTAGSPGPKVLFLVFAFVPSFPTLSLHNAYY